MSPDLLTWLAVAVGAVGCYALKIGGMAIGESALEKAWVRQSADLVPVALLAALVGVQTFATAQELVLDARAAGVAVAGIALLLRAPFIVVVVSAAVTAAVIRLVT